MSFMVMSELDEVEKFIGNCFDGIIMFSGRKNIPGKVRVKYT